MCLWFKKTECVNYTCRNLIKEKPQSNLCFTPLNFM